MPTSCKLCAFSSDLGSLYSGQEYSWLGSIVYFAQLVFQPLSVYALVKFPVNRWICFCFFGWGASCMISAVRLFFPNFIGQR
jgi:hypothetical protein